jgi:Purine nucleobase transmembrane transport
MYKSQFSTLKQCLGMYFFFMWQVIPREAREFGLGKMKYYMALIWDAMFWQLVNKGLVGLISGTPSLLFAMMFALQLPLVEIL